MLQFHIAAICTHKRRYAAVNSIHTAKCRAASYALQQQLNVAAELHLPCIAARIHATRLTVAIARQRWKLDQFILLTFILSDKQALTGVCVISSSKRARAEWPAGAGSWPQRQKYCLNRFFFFLLPTRKSCHCTEYRCSCVGKLPSVASQHRENYGHEGTVLLVRLYILPQPQDEASSMCK